MGQLSKYVQIGQPVFGARDAVGAGITKAAEKNDKIVAVMEDIGFPGLDWFMENAPDRVIECGIAEANAAVVAAGLAAEGFIPFVYSFTFATLFRAYNQIRQSICVDRFNVKLLARGGAWGFLGISHNSTEDFAAMRVLPNMVIVNPGDAVEAEKLVMAIADYIGPVFMRLEADFFSPPSLRIFTEDYTFELGKAHTVQDGADVTIIATGYMLTEAIRASESLEKEGIDIRIINMSTIKPMDEEVIIKAAEETGAIVTAENASIIGGLGEAVATVLAENIPTPMARVGVRDEFSQSGFVIGEGVERLWPHLKLTAKDVERAVRGVIERKSG